MSKSGNEKPVNERGRVSYAEDYVRDTNRRLNDYLKKFNGDHGDGSEVKSKTDIMTSLINNIGADEKFKKSVLQEFAKQDLSTLPDRELRELADLTQSLKKNKAFDNRFKSEISSIVCKSYLRLLANHDDTTRQPKDQLLAKFLTNPDVSDEVKHSMLQEFTKQDLSQFSKDELQEIIKSRDVLKNNPINEELQVLSNGAEFYFNYQQSLTANEKDANGQNLALAGYLDDVMQNAKHPEHFRQAAQICSNLQSKNTLPVYEAERYAEIALKSENSLFREKAGAYIASLTPDVNDTEGVTKYLNNIEKYAYSQKDYAVAAEFCGKLVENKIPVDAQEYAELAFKSGSLDLQEQAGLYVAFQFPNKNDEAGIIKYLDNIEKYARSHEHYAIAAEFCGRLVSEGKFPAVKTIKETRSKTESKAPKSPEEEALAKYVKFASASMDSSYKKAAVEYFWTQHPIVPEMLDLDEKYQKTLAESMTQLSVLTSLMAYKGFSTSGESNSDLSEETIKMLTDTLGDKAGIRQFVKSMNNSQEELSDVQRHATFVAEYHSHSQDAASTSYKIISTLLMESMTDKQKQKYYEKSFGEVLDSVQYYEQQKYRHVNQLDENAKLPPEAQSKVDKLVENIKDNLTKTFQRDMHGNVVKNTNLSIDDQSKYIGRIISHLEPPKDSNRQNLFMAEFETKILKTKADQKSKVDSDLYPDIGKLKELSPAALEKYYAQSFKEVLHLVEKRYLQNHDASDKNQLIPDDQVNLQNEKDKAITELTRLFGRDMSGKKLKLGGKFVEPSKDKIPSGHFLVPVIKDLKSLTQVEEHEIKEELGRERRATMAAPPVSRKTSLSMAASSTVSEIGRRLSSFHIGKRDSQSQSQQSQNQSQGGGGSPSDQGQPQPKRRFTFLSPNSARRESSASQKPEAQDSVSMTLATSRLAQSSQLTSYDLQAQQERQRQESQINQDSKRQRQQSDQGPTKPSRTDKQRRASAMPTVHTVYEESERSVSSRSRSNSVSYSNPPPSPADIRGSSDSISEIPAASPSSIRGSKIISQAHSPSRDSDSAKPRHGSIRPNRGGRNSVVTVRGGRGSKNSGGPSL